MSEPVTRLLSAFALSDPAALPEGIRSEARRAFINYIGCTLSGAAETASAHALAFAEEFTGQRVATVIGHRTRLDAQHAALVNCLQSSIQTFDDTHLSTVIHPTGPVAAAIMALLQHRRDLSVSGAHFLVALAYGVEVSCRVAVALTTPPSRMHVGAFTTGLVGGIGAAVACGRLLQLDERRMAWAIGIAAAQACGLRATHATMSGALVPALGARSGMAAALLAARGFDCSDSALEGQKGLFAVFAPGADEGLAVRDLGRRFDMADLSYKPYPCGIVIHPAIDACLEIAQQAAGAAIASVQLKVHPLALQLTGTRHPVNALSCNVSLFHWTAAVLVRARAGLDVLTEAALHDPAIAAMRDRIEAVASEGVRADEALVEARLDDGRVLASHVRHARGSRERPLSGEELTAKFLGMAVPCLGTARAGELLALLEALPAAGAGWLETIAERMIPS